MSAKTRFEGQALAAKFCRVFDVPMELVTIRYTQDEDAIVYCVNADLKLPTWSLKAMPSEGAATKGDVMVPIIIGDTVSVVDGISKGRTGVIRRTQRQTKGQCSALFWVELAPGELHAFHREHLAFEGLATLHKRSEQEDT